MTEKQLVQRRSNVQKIAKQRREAETCFRGHSDWYISPRGTRGCRVCRSDDSFYRWRGLPNPNTVGG